MEFSLHPAQLEEEQLLQDVHLERTRGSGPGGQHRNRVATEVRLHHRPTGIRSAAGERRSAKDNKRVALMRLRINLALKWRRPLQDSEFVAPGEFQPTELWKGRLKGTKIAVNPGHRDFPALLAECLDGLALYDHDTTQTAEAFRISKSQLVKFLALEPAALHLLNEVRKANGQGPLRS